MLSNIRFSGLILECKTKDAGKLDCRVTLADAWQVQNPLLHEPMALNDMVVDVDGKKRLGKSESIGKLVRGVKGNHLTISEFVGELQGLICGKRAFINSVMPNIAIQTNNGQILDGESAKSIVTIGLVETVHRGTEPKTEEVLDVFRKTKVMTLSSDFDIDDVLRCRVR